MSNTEIWDKLRRVPPDQLKSFKRAGGFSGSAIRPMWSFHKMTEVFGPVGNGWRIGPPSFQTVEGQNNEILVFCTVGVIVDGDSFYGVGGDKVVKYIAPNEQCNRPARWENDDEAFKKAYTDALTNALKLLGVGADVHMGLWDGNKYVDEKPEPAKEPAKAPTYDRNPIVEEAYKAMDIWLNNIGNTGTLEDLAEFWKENQKTIRALPADWLKELTAKKDEVKATLTEKVSA